MTKDDTLGIRRSDGGSLTLIFLSSKVGKLLKVLGGSILISEQIWWPFYIMCSHLFIFVWLVFAWKHTSEYNPGYSQGPQPGTLTIKVAKDDTVGIKRSDGESLTWIFLKLASCWKSWEEAYCVFCEGGSSGEELRPTNQERGKSYLFE